MDSQRKVFRSKLERGEHVLNQYFQTHPYAFYDYKDHYRFREKRLKKIKGRIMNFWKIAGLFIGVAIVVIVSIAFVIWFIPLVTTRSYNWGKTVCVISKPAYSFIQDITCQDF